ncbi:MAG: acyltransferase [Prevotellaceae bacterium]|nr:acyltransferase [Prevotellaceae bacterium]
MKTANRYFAMDLLRVFACFLVIHQHCAEMFYGATGHTEVGDDTFFIGINTSFGRICVPLFVMVSGYFLLPMKDCATQFFKKRLTRILIPFVVWYLVYSVFNMFRNNGTVLDATCDFLGILVNFHEVWGGHMWFVYMLVGLYLITPVISPWLERVSLRQLRIYLCLWIVSTLLPYLNQYVNPEMWGACFWNPSPTLHYFTGFAGYFVLGHYIRRYGATDAWRAVLLIVVGYAVTAYFFIQQMYVSYEFADLEMGFDFNSLNVVMMSYGVFCLFAKIKWQGENRLGRLLSDFAVRSYGIYLMHMIVLLLVYDTLLAIWPEAYQVITTDGYTYHRVLGGIPAVLVAMPVHAVLTFVIVYIVARVLGLLPKANKWLGV